MKVFIKSFVIILAVTSISSLLAQSTSRPKRLIKPKKADKSVPIREIVKYYKKPTIDSSKVKEIPLKTNPYLLRRSDKNFKGDPVLQRMPANFLLNPPILSFDGLSNEDNLNTIGFRVVPPDPNGDVGPEHYVQMINLISAIYDKNGNIVLGPFPNNVIWAGFGGLCESNNNGDPIVLYDPLADRWLITQFALDFANNQFSQCVACSETGDPTGSYFRYEFPFGEDFPDYPKFGVWPDAYLATFRIFGAEGFDMVAGALEREAIINGNPTAQIILFSITDILQNYDGSRIDGVLPVDLDGLPPNLNTPGFFIGHQDNSWTLAPEDRLALFELIVDWTNPANSNFSGPIILPVKPFDYSVFGVPQPSTLTKLDALPFFMMHRAAVRNMGSYLALVANHTVDVGDDHAGIRWYELRYDENGWSIYQQGTYAPNQDNRFMGSIAMNVDGTIALGFSVSGSNTFPSIHYTGRPSDAPLGQMIFQEQSIIEGNGAQMNYSRWGDYTMMAVDPSDETTFWYTNEYYDSTSYLDFKTRIGAFKLQIGQGPQISVIPDNLDFGYIFLGESSETFTVRIWNVGDNNLEITDISTSSPFNLSNLPSFPKTISPLDSLSFDVYFEPTMGGEAIGNITISSNDSDDPLVTVELKGHGVDLNVQALIWSPTILLSSPQEIVERAREKGMDLTLEDAQRMFEKRSKSTDEISAALDANGITNSFSPILPQIISNQYLFVVLGHYPANFVVYRNSPEALAIEDYIANGGNVYMEGGEVWFFDPKYSGGHDFNELFGIMPLDDGEWDELNYITGTAIAQGQNFDYNVGVSHFPDHIKPLMANAFVIHTNDHPKFYCGIANPFGTDNGPRTIGTSFEFGELIDGSSPSTKVELIANYLEFFDNGIAGPYVVFQPDSFMFVVKEGGMKTRKLVLKNSGTEMLNWEIKDSSLVLTPFKSPVKVKHLNSLNLNTTVQPWELENSSVLEKRGFINSEYIKGTKIEETNEDVIWLSTNPTSGSLAPGDSEEVEVIVDVSGIPLGNYSAQLVINSNGINPQLFIPVNLVAYPSRLGEIGVVVNSDDASIQIVDGTNNIIFPPSLMGNPGYSSLLDVVITPDGQAALVSNFVQRTVYLIDISNPLTPIIIGSVNLSIYSEDIALTEDGKFAVITDGSGGNLVEVIDVSTMSVIQTLNISPRSAQACAVGPDGTVLFCDFYASQIHVFTIDITSGLLTDLSTTLNVGSGPINVAISPDGQTALVAEYYSSSISVFKITAPGVLTFVNSITNISNPQTIVFQSDGQRAYVLAVGYYPDKLAILNVNGPGNVTDSGFRIELTNTNNSGYYGVDLMDVTKDGSRAYIGNGFTGEIAVVDLNSLSIITYLTAGEYPTGIALGGGGIICNFTATLSVSDNCNNNISLFFGTCKDATDGYDSDIDELAPPPPPAGAFDGRFRINGLDLFSDFRAPIVKEPIVWDVYYQSASNCDPITLTWNQSEFPVEGNFRLMDPFDGSLVDIDMRSQSSFTDELGLGHLQIEYSITKPFNYILDKGWNLIGLSHEVEDRYYLSVFPGANPGTLFGFNGTYFAEDTLELSKGYWINFPEQDTVMIEGYEIYSSTVVLDSGWNLIAGPSCSVPFSNIIDPDKIIVPGTLYGFAGAYYLADSVKPGEGYWLNAKIGGQILISCSPGESPVFAKIGKKFKHLNLHNYPTLQISDAAGFSQNLYFNVSLKNPDEKLSFLLPPIPPPGSFDVRFSDNFKISESDEAFIQVQSSQFPIFIKVFNLPSGTKYEYTLTEFLENNEVNVHRLKEGEVIEIYDSKITKLKLSKTSIKLPQKFFVYQNYPNPFNPTTEIRFALPKDSKVEINVYNVLGQKIRNLLRDYKTAGYYKVVWDGTNDSGEAVGSGVYFYTVRTGDYIAIKKMVYLR